MGELKRKHYEKLLEPMQAELVAMARWVAATGQRLVVLFEGRDTAGKGGAIQAIADKLNPRQCRVVALPKPTDAEARPMVFPALRRASCRRAGQIALFDRSWYNRAGRREGHGLCHRRAGRGVPRRPCRSSKRCWSTTASCCSNIG